jgi:hypothetical protein
VELTGRRIATFIFKHPAALIDFLVFISNNRAVIEQSAKVTLITLEISSK